MPSSFIDVSGKGGERQRAACYHRGTAQRRGAVAGTACGRRVVSITLASATASAKSVRLGKHGQVLDNAPSGVVTVDAAQP